MNPKQTPKEKMVASYLGGDTLEEIGKQNDGISRERVRQVLVEMEVPRRNRGRPAGATRKEMPLCPECKVNHLSSKKSKRCLSCKQDEATARKVHLAALWNSDKPTEEIAQELGVAIPTLHVYAARARKAGFQLRNRKERQ